MSLLFTVLRVLLRGRDKPRAASRTPGPSPQAILAREAVAILAIVTGGVLWMLVLGCSPGVALGVVGGIGLITAEVLARLARLWPAVS